MKIRIWAILTWVWATLSVVGLIATVYFFLLLGRTSSEGPHDYSDWARFDRAVMTVNAYLGTSLLILTVSANLLLGSWQRQVKSSETKITSDYDKQAGFGRASIIIFRFVLLFFSAIALCYFGFSVTPPQRSGEWGGLNLIPLLIIQCLLAVAAWGISVLGVILAMAGFLQTQRRRSMTVAGLLLNGIIALIPGFVWLAIETLSP